MNDTGHYVWIQGSSDGITTTITIYGTNDGRKVEYSVGDLTNVQAKTTVKILDPNLRTGKTTVFDTGQDGRQCTVVRTVRKPDGTVIYKDTFVSTWQMFPMTILVGSGTTSTTTGSISTTATTEPSTSTTATTEPTTTTATTAQSTTTTSPPATGP